MRPALLLLLVALPAGAVERAPLPPELIALDSDAGQRLLLESKANRDFFPLMINYQAQQSGSYCAVASTVMVLNALPIAAPPAPDFQPYHAYTQNNVFNDDARRLGVARGGLTLEMLAALLRTQPTEVEVHYASETTLDAFRRLAVHNLETTGDYVIINYLRSAVGQEPLGLLESKLAGHVSPLGAYHAGSDRFLILDVNRWKYPPVWVEAKLLYAAMNTVDVDSGKTRGFVLVRAAANAQPPASIVTPHNRLLLMAGLIVAIAFLLGIGATLLASRLRSRPR